MKGKKPFTAQDYIAKIRTPHERNGYRLPDPENTKGGTYHGGPKRWTGKGPAPARHIPWPELFRHHISLVEGHMKMIDMVRKHTIEGSANWEMICTFLERCQTMLRDSKQAAITFVPPPNHRDHVPLGSSSASMYPGYSPADHVYGEAAEDFGKYAAEAQKRGIKLEHPGGVDYTVAQVKQAKKRMTEEYYRQMAEKEGDGEAQKGLTTEHERKMGDADAVLRRTDEFKSQQNDRVNGNHKQDEDAAKERPDAEIFVVDTQPMQLDLPTHGPPPHMNGIGATQRKNGKHGSPSEGEDEQRQAGDPKSKKVKTKHDGALPASNVETEDISAEVEARLKEKRSKKKDKEKKRKRDEADDEESGVGEVKKSKKKKRSEAKDQVSDDLGADVNGTKKKSRKKKRGSDGVDGDGAEDNEGRKRKKSKGGI